jgi:hypothetical protein
MIQEFTSINDASRELHISSSCISACCRGITLQTNGFHFKYKTDIDKEVRSKKRNFTCGKKIYQYDTNHVLIKTFHTIKECADAFHVSRTVMTNRIKGITTKCEELNKYSFELE